MGGASSRKEVGIGLTIGGKSAYGRVGPGVGAGQGTVGFTNKNSDGTLTGVEFTQRPGLVTVGAIFVFRGVLSLVAAPAVAF